MKSKLVPVLLFAVAYAVFLSGCSGPSSEELARIKEECVQFYKTERAKSYSIVKAVDHWTKDGRVVIELSERESAEAKKYISNLCVYDKEKGTISLPGALHQGHWIK